MFPANVFVDPTIPGLSIRDLQEKPAESITSREGSAADFAIKRALSGLDREALRDLGYDRAAA